MTAEQDWTRLLEGVDLSGMESLNSTWDIKNDPLNDSRDEKRYSISQGLASIEFRITEESAVVLWDGNPPDYLVPGNGLESFNEFMDWMKFKLPWRLYGERERSLSNYKLAYQEYSTISIKYTNGKREIYRMAEEKDDRKLALDFVTKKEEIESYVVTGSEQPLFRKFDYKLMVRKLNENGAPQIGLHIPMDIDRLQAWNDKSIGWVLGMHANSDLLNDLTQNAEELGNLLRLKTEEQLNEK